MSAPRTPSGSPSATAPGTSADTERPADAPDTGTAPDTERPADAGTAPGTERPADTGPAPDTERPATAATVSATAVTKGSLRRVTREARPFLRARTGPMGRLSAWSLLEFGQTLIGGYAVAQALDRGFLHGAPAVGLLWLAVAALAVLPAALATRGVFAGLADLVEPLRDGLVRRAVTRGLGEALDGGPADSRSVSRVTHQSEIARDGWGGLVLSLRSFVFTAVGALAGMAVLSPRLLLVVLPPLLAGIALFAVTLAPMAVHQRAYLDADEAFAAHTGTAAGALTDIAAAGGSPQVRERAARLTDDQTRAARSLARWAATRIVALGLCGALPPILLLLTAPWLLDHGLTTGGLLGAFTYLTQSLAPAVHALLTVLGTAGGRLVVVLDRFTRPLSLPSPPAAHPRHGHALPEAPLTAELRSVSFAYGPAARPVVDGLDLGLRPGERLAVVGPSGSGKSTLAALLAGVLPPTRGEVRWLGRPAASPDGPEPTALRTLLPQQAYIFTATLRDNLRYLRPGATDREITDALAELGADRLAERVGGLDAPVGPARLSQGERQLLALVRAHLTTVPLLVLDEATSHLDPAAEARAEDALARRPRTLVVIAHRLASARRADRVLLMDGAATDYGTPDELLARSARYRDLAGHWAPDHRIPQPR
ncbi:ATP-binding cassette domain-containing protein [Streptomyces uncialis]|uniref:ATP-binding cassette domain-containing protein n=1 Tax=Streptomyces uncialis TaxID=1048205 RepID=UPI0038179A1B